MFQFFLHFPEENCNCAFRSRVNTKDDLPDIYNSNGKKYDKKKLVWKLTFYHSESLSVQFIYIVSTYSQKYI